MPTGRKSEKREAGGEERQETRQPVYYLRCGNSTPQSRARKGAGPPAYAGGSVSLLRGGAVKGRKAADLHKTLDPRYACERAFG